MILFESIAFYISTIEKETDELLLSPMSVAAAATVSNSIAAYQLSYGCCLFLPLPPSYDEAPKTQTALGGP